MPDEMRPGRPRLIRRRNDDVGAAGQEDGVRTIYGDREQGGLGCGGREACDAGKDGSGFSGRVQRVPLS